MLAYFIEFCGSIRGRYAAVRPVRFVAVFLLSGVFLACAAARSAEADIVTFTWDGDDGAAWNVADNWTPAGGPPDGNTHAVIIETAEKPDSIPADIVLGALTLQGDFAGTLDMLGTLTICSAAGASGDLMVDAGTLRTHTSTAAADAYSGNITVSNTFTIGSDGTVVVRRSYAPHPHEGHGGAGQTIAAGEMVVAGLLSADGQGFDSRRGPGGMDASNVGGTHGGVGGLTVNSYNTEATYGSFLNPVSLGSGGASTCAFGGGAIVLDVEGTLAVTGTVSANGADTTAGSASSGAGGSINITAGELAGGGLISARGGNVQGSSPRGGGGGGRISVVNVTVNNFAGSLLVNMGHTGDANRMGFTGTISFPQNFDLTLGADPNYMTTLRLGADDDAAFNAFGAITILDGGVLEIDGNPGLNPVEGDIAHGGAAPIVAESIEILSGGKISADGLGFRAQSGPAGGSAMGGTHGGVGYNNTNKSYGSFEEPVAMGSGSSDMRGGGALVFDVTGTVTNHGTISAGSQPPASSDHGAAGGSVNLTAAELTGNGEIIADGGGGGTSPRGGGGGGRISFVNVLENNFTGIIRAHGGTDGIHQRSRGTAGTIAFPPDYDLVLDAGRWPVLRLGADIHTVQTFNSIEIGDGAVLELDFNPVADGGIGMGADIHAKHIDVKPGGSISAVNLGFSRRNGPGRNDPGGDGRYNTTQIGAAHGGMGANNVRDAYDSVLDPTGGGSGSRTYDGGGVIMLAVAGTLTIDGDILACGSGANRNNEGGSAGGAVNLRAGRIEGGGHIRADGGGGTNSGQRGGGGGRIAVRTPDYSHTGEITALGGPGQTGQAYDGAAGTVYLETAGEPPGHGRLLVDNNARSAETGAVTQLPSPGGGGEADEFMTVTLKVKNNGKVGLTDDLTVGDLIIVHD